MPKFRKKPIVIEAVQFKGQVTDEIRELYGARYIVGNNEPAIFVDTLEGTMKVSLNDWIIRGVKGELYPCKPDIFETTYERVD